MTAGIVLPFRCQDTIASSVDNDPRGILGLQVEVETNELRRAMEVSTGALVRVGAWRWEEMRTMWVWRGISRSPSPLHLSVISVSVIVSSF